MKATLKPTTVGEYIASFPKGTQTILTVIRKAVKEAVPNADESISYAMPAYKLAGRPLVYFAAYEKHIGFYATPSGHAAFEKELSKYKQGKGSVQFPIDEPMPLTLISKMTKFNAKKILEKASKVNKVLKRRQSIAQP